MPFCDVAASAVACTACSAGFELVSGSLCGCPEGSFLRGEKCEKCGQNCANCAVLGEFQPVFCTGCGENYFLADGECFGLFLDGSEGVCVDNYFSDAVSTAVLASEAAETG